MTTIRPATINDVPRIVEMAEQFYATAYAEWAPLDRNSAAGLAIVTMEQYILLVVIHADRACGMISMSFEPFTFNVNFLVANEIAFWLDPEVRGLGIATELIQEMEVASKMKGVQIVRMAKMANSPAHVDALYESLGYVLTDSHWMKRL